MSSQRVLVVGGGITGLSLAFTLVEEARARGTDVDVSLIEAGRPGGHACTIVEDGFIVEGGPNGFLDREPETRDLIKALDLESQLVEARPEAKRRFIVRNGRLCRVPEGPSSLLSSDALSLRAKLRLLYEPFAPGPPAGVDETVYDFSRRRIGPEAAEMLVDAAVSGISAGDSRALSVRSQFPLMVEMERDHGSLIRALIARRKRGTGPARLLSFTGGLATLVDALTTRLGGAVHANTTVVAIERRGRRWRVTTDRGGTFEADRLVLAVSSRVAADLAIGFDPDLAEALQRIPSSGVNLVALAYRTADVPRDLDGYGYLVTRPEQLATLGVVWESSLFPRRAPEGMALLRVFLGGARRPDVARLGEAAALAIARDELQRVMGIVAEPARTWSFRWPGAIAQYTVGHAERIAAIRERLARHEGLEVCGTSYDGVSFNHAVAAGRKLGRAMARAAAEAPASAPAAAAEPAVACS
jgi:oxygen-dependent protoporphyrinogen oxidase